MTDSKSMFRRLMVGALSLSAVVALAACEQPQDTATTPTVDPVPTTEAAPDTTLPGQTPVAGAETVAEVVNTSPEFSTLNAAIEAADLGSTLSEPGPFTVFAPTDEAFAALPQETQDALLLPENQDTLRQILTYHVVPGNVASDAITPGEIATVEGSSVTAASTGGELTVDGANVVQTDIAASNGVIHVIDQVLIPPGLQI